VSPVNYELGFYIPEDDILHSDRLGNLTSNIVVLLGKSLKDFPIGQTKLNLDYLGVE
jgi:hypothetical protein